MAGGTRTTALALLLLPLLVLGGCAGREEDDAFADAGAAPEGPVLPYEVTIEGAGDASLRAALEAASASRAEIGRPPASLFLLERRAKADLPNLEQALQAEGYFDGVAAAAVRDRGAAHSDGIAGLGGSPRYEMRFAVTTGERYRLARLQLAVADPANGFTAPTPSELRLEAGAPARSAPLLEAHTRLLDRARSAGHPFAALPPIDAVIDRSAKTLDARLVVTTGPAALLGRPQFVGGDNVARPFLARRAGFVGGERYDPAKVAEARRSLAGTNLFSTVVVREGSALDPDGRLPVTFELTERKPRSIGAGLGFQTDEGPNASLFWEHRNGFGAGERLRLDLYGSPLRQEATGTLRKPDVLRQGQNLLGDLSIRAEDNDAYESRSAGAGVGLERLLAPGLKGTAGIAYRLVETREKGEAEERFALVSLPLGLSYDGSDDLLDPKRGYRVDLRTAPFFDTLGSGSRFLKSSIGGSAYLPIGAQPRAVVALRSRLGSIAGAEQDEIPADERFYAGGGGSVRGFGYQLAGPLDEDDDPIGGRSVFEANGELRLRVTDSIGVVGFLDAGTAYEASYPEASESLRLGTGMGLRYATPIGPVRLDVGVPLNPREGVDDPYQIYISIGQAF